MLSKLSFFAGAFTVGAFNALVGQTTAPATDAGSLAEWGRYGLLGLVLGFVLWRLEPRLAKLEQALNWLTQMIRLMLIEIKATSPGVRDQAVSIAEEMKAAGIKDS